MANAQNRSSHAEPLERRRLLSGTAEIDVSVRLSPSLTAAADAPALTGTPVTLYLDLNDNGRPDAGEARLTSSTDRFAFANLAPDNYLVRQVVPGGYAQVALSRPADGFDGLALSVTVEAGDRSPATANRFYDANTGIVTGVVTVDAFSAGAGGGAGIVVYADLNDNGRRDAGEPSDTTGTHPDPTGNGTLVNPYVLTGLRPGTAVIRQVVPAGFVAAGVTRQTVTVAVAQVTVAQPFGVLTPNCAIRGALTLDPSGEPFAGRAVSVYLDANENGRFDRGERATATDPVTGGFSFTGLTVGTYQVRQVLPPRYFQTSIAVIENRAVADDDDGEPNDGLSIGVECTSAGSTTDLTIGDLFVGVPWTGTVIGTAGSYGNRGNTIARAVDGKLSTFFDGPRADGNSVGLDLGVPRPITAVAFASRSGFESRMNGGTFEASNSPAFPPAETFTLFTVQDDQDPPSTSLSAFYAPADQPYRYVRYVGPAGSYGNVSEVQFYGAPPAPLAGVTFGTAGSYANAGRTVGRATDGNLSTFFDGPRANGNVVGLDLGSAKVVRQIDSAPRSGYAARMVGGYFQASNSSTFATGVATLYTVDAAPAVGVLTNVESGTATAYRYWRYVAPDGSYGNVAEFQLFA